MNRVEQQRPNERVMDWMKRWVNPRHGLMRKIVLAPNIAGAAPYFRVLAYPSIQSGRGKPQATKNRRMRVGTGFAVDLNSAFFSSFGEAIERYCAGIWFDDEMVTATGVELGKASEHVTKLVLRGKGFQGKPDNYQPYDSCTARRWTLARNILTEEKAWFPSQQIWFDYEPIDTSENIGLISSNGIAAGPDFASATCSALLELIERDALMCRWFLRAEAEHISYDDVLKHCINVGVRRYIEERSLEVRFLYLSNEFRVPVVFVLIVDERNGVIGTGASANFRAEVAASKALSEAFMTYSDQLSRNEAKAQVGDADSIKRFHDHIDFYRDTSRWPALDVFRNPARVISLTECSQEYLRFSDASPESRVATLVDALHGFGYDAYSVSMTRDDAADAGFEVVRAVVPGLQPLMLGAVVPFNESRLDTFALRNGIKKAALNLAVHPFA